MHYGHALTFGTFLTPSARDPGQVVSLATRAEELGFDLVTIQDHPYQPAHLDAWTLLTWLAGRTRRVTLAPGVLNLPLRAPAVLAGAAASLDRLSGGRLALALGAGAFWKAIGAMGGRTLSPGESVAALSEAIDLIRARWDVTGEGPVRLHGEHYHVDGAARGPAPAHDVPLWLGAAKPRMLRLLGEKADGWVVTHQLLRPGQLAQGNRRIDEAAVAAGRDPREIRRLLNVSGDFLGGPGEKWVEELLPLVVDDGVGTFILMTDDAETLERFAGEVAPALREAVERELPGAFRRPLRRAAVRARRREGIAYDDLPETLADTTIEPGDVGYAEVRSTYLRGGAPGLVLRPGTEEEVAEALAFARAHPHLPLSLRSGGHGISGRSTNDGGIVLDVSRLDSIDVVDPARRRVHIGPGARWMDVAAALAPHGLALTSGDYGGVGVGGLATAGGLGFLARKHGLTIDHLRAVRMVLADGSVVRASDHENPDLFWAVRGAGANFGIVTSFEFEADEVGDVGWAQLVFDASDTAGLLHRWGAAQEAAPRDVTSFLLVSPPRRGRPPMAHLMAMVDTADPETILDRLRPLAEIGPLYDQSVVLTSYASVMANASPDAHDGRGEPVTRSAFAEHITPEFAADAERLIRGGAVYFFQIRSVGGAVADVPPDATAYAHRSANFSVTTFGVDRRRVDAAWDRLAEHVDGLYLSFETDTRPERLADAFPPATLRRLRELKAAYDPDNVFRDNFNITPSTTKEPTHA
ncbi:LLM class flavin-dependent oxidoreductase [Prauserella flavalba]|uniref:FAD-linked oxidase n=1 Tax=Prauserella flavalba TaxID=1477506 RepID=A0A318LVM2_9PSEU|nr:LLM class flavin-dependent oxidoreductase [Prauserella flavalba]PXY36408.1 FAD-linked oxidase [Prauserella flavalba]